MEACCKLCSRSCSVERVALERENCHAIIRTTEDLHATMQEQTAKLQDLVEDGRATVGSSEETLRDAGQALDTQSQALKSTIENLR